MPWVSRKVHCMFLRDWMKRANNILVLLWKYRGLDTNGRVLGHPASQDDTLRTSAAYRVPWGHSMNGGLSYFTQWPHSVPALSVSFPLYPNHVSAWLSISCETASAFLSPPGLLIPFLQVHPPLDLNGRQQALESKSVQRMPNSWFKSTAEPRMKNNLGLS